MKIHLPLALTLFASFYTHSAPPMSCNIGPAHTELAAAKWQVTSCSDGQSLVFATMKGNPAMPFMFFIKRDGDKTTISGEGKGSKEYSSKAFEELRTMTESQFEDLIQATMLVDLNN